jgi:hypothetical protein
MERPPCRGGRPLLAKNLPVQASSSPPRHLGLVAAPNSLAHHTTTHSRTPLLPVELPSLPRPPPCSGSHLRAHAAGDANPLGLPNDSPPPCIEGSSGHAAFTRCLCCPGATSIAGARDGSVRSEEIDNLLFLGFWGLCGSPAQGDLGAFFFVSEHQYSIFLSLFL